MGAPYPIIHSGFRCRRPNPDAHQCLLVVGWHRATARSGLTSPPSMRKFQRVSNLPASPSRWTLVQYELAPCPLWVISRHVRCKRSCPLYPIATANANFRKRWRLLHPRKRTCAVQVDVCFGPKADKPRRISSKAVSQSGAEVEARESKSHAR